MLMYCGGLQVEKIINLGVEDIDSNRRRIHIKVSKGRKYPYTLLSDISNLFEMPEFARY